MRLRVIRSTLVALLLLLSASGAAAQQTLPCVNTTHADVVAIDQAFYNNRMGALQPGGMIFALRDDVVKIRSAEPLVGGNVMLRPDKRPRPMVLRVPVGDCIEIRFENLLRDVPNTYNPDRFPPSVTTAGGGTTKRPYTANDNDNERMYDPDSGRPAWPAPGPPLKPGDPIPPPPLSQPATRLAGVHVMGMNLLSARDTAGALIPGIRSDGSWVGSNDVFEPNRNVTRRASLIEPSSATKRTTITYLLYAPGEGSYLLYSTAANFGLGPELVGGQLSEGLFGAVTVHPKKSEFYRSQVTFQDLRDATVRGVAANVTAGAGTVPYRGQNFPLYTYTPTGAPVILIKNDGTPGGVGSGAGVHTRTGQPILDYQARRGNKPILRMTDTGNNIVHTDLTAFITGPNAGPIAAPQPGNDNIYPERQQAYREFVIIYHDDFPVAQAFPQFDVGDLQGVLLGGKDNFAINYGIGGIGAEILANRFGVGPMHACATCRFEEFFLSSWTNGDPAQVVDFPANSRLCGGEHPEDCSLQVGPKATRAYYPDDPSNTYHSYMSDHVKIQILHGGVNITHVHHLHAHQWLHTPASENSAYRDSQMISPGGAYTLSHVYNGSGNHNKTVGDSIFHCHFYPHFAMGMWSLWRVHDTFEEGTRMNADQTVVAGPNEWNRALPDGEIAAGTPTPALVPLPTNAMASMPARVRMRPVSIPYDGSDVRVGYAVETNPDDKDESGRPLNPGYPFFIPGVAGQRAPHPPMDYAVDTDKDGNKITLDGGLPRFLGLWDPRPFQQQTRWDFTKFNNELTAVQLAEDGEPSEKVAMATHAVRNHPSFKPDGTPATFILNGLPPAQGAPYADPAVDSSGQSVCKDPPGSPLAPGKNQPCMIRYKAADIQIDTVFNKKGWHYPQTRLITLWGDVAPTIANARMPQPFFFRANSRQVIEYWLANLVPNFYELDDFQVRTPTDIIGQHIHLVKFDVTSSDGAANGYNYEDGTLSPNEVREQIANINKRRGIFTQIAPAAGGIRVGGPQRILTPKNIPFFGDGPNKDSKEWVGAQATVQRWYADAVIGDEVNVDDSRVDHTLRTVFTHDHFGPSTHQQAGLYAGLLIEPTESQWINPIDGSAYGSNLNRPMDGGPTGWQANIIDTKDPGKSYREFAIEFQDRQLGYLPGSVEKLSPYDPLNLSAYRGWSDPAFAINPPGAGTGPFPRPQLVTSTFGVGTYSLNYRSEPLPFRLAPGAAPDAADLGSVFRSIVRNDPALNIQPKQGDRIFKNAANDYPFRFSAPFPGAQPTDPYTPLLRAYEGDNVQIRTLVGAHMFPHSFTVHGMNWQFEPQDRNSGFRATQPMGISEHYEFLVNVPKTGTATNADYFFSSSSDVNGLGSGNWGLIRAYANGTTLPDVARLPNNPAAPSPAPDCTTWGAGTPQKTFNVRAVRVRDLDNGFPLYYNTRGRPGANGGNQLADPNALVYVLSGTVPRNHRIEPLVLRVNAGDCITVNLKNDFNIGSSPSDRTAGQTTLANKNYTTQFPVTASATDVAGMVSLFTINTYGTQFRTLFNQNPGGFSLPADPTTSRITVNSATSWTIAASTGTFNVTGPTPAATAGQSTLTVSTVIPLSTSQQAGLHAQLLAYDVTKSEGINVGTNPVQTAAPGQSVKYVWYAGQIDDAGKGTPVEFGSVNLTPADPLRQHPYGLLGALIVEPQGAVWREDSNSMLSAVVTKQDGAKFREFVTVVQDDIASMGMTPPGPTEAAFQITAGPGPNDKGFAWATQGTANPNNSVYVVAPNSLVTVTMNQPAPVRHGLAFPTEAAAKAVFNVVQPGSSFSVRKVPPNAGGVDMWATTPIQCKGQVIATLRVKGAPGAKLPFECSQHGKSMAGSFYVDDVKPDLLIQGENITGGHAWKLNGATQPNNSTYKVKPGQIVRFAVLSGFHGLNLLTSQASVEAFFDVLPASQPLALTNVGGGYGTRGLGGGMVLATLRVKNLPNGTALPFECTIHRAGMAGRFQVDTSGGGGGTVHTLAGDRAPGFVWRFDGVVQNNDAQYPLKAGDTLNVVIQDGLHGLTLLQQSDLAKFFTVTSGNFVPQTDFGANAVGTNPQNSGTIAVLTVKSGVSGSAPFLCTQHGASMAGTFVISGETGTTHTLAGDRSPGFVWRFDGAVQNNDAQYPLKAGDTLNVVIQDGLHGLTLLQQSDLAKFFTVTSGNFVPQTRFGANAVGTNPQNSGTIAVLTVKSGVSGSAPFLCTQHGTSMAGTFVIGDSTGTTHTLAGDRAPGFVWRFDGAVQNNDAQYPLKAGDTLNVVIQNGLHGLTLLQQSDLAKFFTVTSGNFVPQTGFGANAVGTNPQNSGTIAVLTVKSGVSGSAPFLCTQHGASMAGTFVIGNAAAPPTSFAPVPQGFTFALNYKTEPAQYRFAGGASILENHNPCQSLSPLGISRLASNTLVLADPQTPVFVASAGMPVRIRMIHPAGNSEEVFTLHGHNWPEEPYTAASTIIGRNADSNRMGSRDAFGPNVSFDLVLDDAGPDGQSIGAGGIGRTPGDYLFRTFMGGDFWFGLWGLLRVGEPGKDVITVTNFPRPGEMNVPPDGGMITGLNSINPDTGTMADFVLIESGAIRQRVPVDPLSGAWTLANRNLAPPVKLTSLKCNDAACSSPATWATLTAPAFIALIAQNASADMGTVDTSAIDAFKPKAEQTNAVEPPPVPGGPAAAQPATPVAPPTGHGTGGHGNHGNGNHGNDTGNHGGHD